MEAEHIFQYLEKSEEHFLPKWNTIHKWDIFHLLCYCQKQGKSVEVTIGICTKVILVRRKENILEIDWL